MPRIELESQSLNAPYNWGPGFSIFNLTSEDDPHLSTIQHVTSMKRTKGIIFLNHKKPHPVNMSLHLAWIASGAIMDGLMCFESALSYPFEMNRHLNMSWEEKLRVSKTPEKMLSTI